MKDTIYALEIMNNSFFKIHLNRKGIKQLLKEVLTMIEMVTKVTYLKENLIKSGEKF